MEKWQEAFCENLRKSPNVSKAARLAGYSRAHVYRLKGENEEFAAAWDDALQESLDTAEGELYRRAVRGVVKPVYQGGEKVGAIREFSDTLMIFLLKAHRPAIYRETVRQEHTGADGDVISVRSVDYRNGIDSA